MQQKLKEADERQTKINWVNEGAAQFSEIIKNEAEDISKLGDKIISFMMKYLDVNQGALYIIEDEKLKRISTYAYGKKRYIDQTIEIGQGLVGQCAIEKQTIYLKQIPSEYVKISSGLGEATPNNVIIIPILLRDQMLGVLELASFKVLEEFRVKFIENITENIASLIFNKQSASQTQKLLNESQERAEILAQQEEEMRQNAEELQATQEEMTRQKQELEREIVKLKRRLEPDQVYA
jgi:putative methionine-R-sulfoxide reductase with GAF domain